MQWDKDYINQVIEGDCLNKMADMPAECIDLVVTDIPYGEVTRKCNIRNMDKGNADILTFDLHIFTQDLIRLTTGSIYIFCGQEQVSTLLDILRHNQLSSRLCIWEKTNPAPINGQYLWLSSIECCVFAKKPNATFNRHCESVVWRFPCGHGKQHPTEKPLKLMEFLIESSSNIDDIVFDPCIGSGTTAVAAKMLGRNFVGIELDKSYCEITRLRIAAAETQLEMDL